MKLRQLTKQNGDGIAVLVYGVTLMLVFTFLAINVVNGQIIESGYNSLRDAVQSASTGSVIHLLMNTDSTTEEQGNVIDKNGMIEKDDNIPPYDLYLQLALGYIINRAPNGRGIDATTQADSNKVQTGNVNNFIKLDHKKVIGSTLALLEDSVIRGKETEEGVHTPLDITNTKHFKILMIFIEPHYNNNDYEKYFNIIVYGNGDVERNGKNLTYSGKTYFAGARSGDPKDVYDNVQNILSEIVNHDDPIGNGKNYRLEDTSGRRIHLKVSLTDGNHEDEKELMRKMETKPYYLIVVKDFALPTLFRNTYTNLEEESNIFKDVFNSLSGDGHLKTPIVALNSAKIERKVEGSNR